MFKHCAEFGNDPSALAMDVDHVIAGFTPSGSADLHMGHHTTMFNFARALAANRSATGTLHADDREFGLQRDPVLVSDAKTQRLIGNLKQCLGALAEYFGDSTLMDRVDIVSMSQLYGETLSNGESLGAGFYKMLMDNRCQISKAFNRMMIHGKQGIRPHCPECKTGFLKKSRKNAFDDTEIIGICYRDECPTDLHLVDVASGDTRWSIHYSLVSLLSLPLSQLNDNGAVLAIQGGDYGVSWGTPNKHFDNRAMSKGERANVAATAMTGDDQKIIHFAGPLLERMGTKLSKSNGDADENIDVMRIERFMAMNQPTIETHDDFLMQPV